MRTITLACAASLALAFSALADWKTDFEAAKTQAAKEKKLVFLDFTGSDWCGPCIRLKQETLSQKAFLDYAAKHLVLVEVDFPARKRLPAEQQKANNKLQEKFNIEGYPTLILTDAAGKEISRHVGYLSGGPVALIDKIEAAKKKAR